MVQTVLRVICLFTGLIVCLFVVACGERATDPAPPTPVASAAEDTPGLIHTVLFWLRDDLTEQERRAFVVDNQSLAEIPSVQRLYFGPPAATAARDVIDSTFDYALILHFADLAGQDAYQVHPLHLEMVEQHSDKFERIVVYDSEVMD